MARLSIDEIISLRTRAVSGDARAYNRLRLENEVLAKRANTRLSALEKAGRAYYAYERAVGYTTTEYGRKRFTVSQKLLGDPQALSKNIMELRTFLGAETSTISGQKRVIQKRIKTFKELGIELPQGREDDFLRWLGNSSLQDALSTVGHGTITSGELVEILVGSYDAIRVNRQVRVKVEKMLDQFVNNEIAYDEVTDYIKTLR